MTITTNNSSMTDTKARMYTTARDRVTGEFVSVQFYGTMTTRYGDRVRQFIIRHSSGRAGMRDECQLQDFVL